MKRRGSGRSFIARKLTVLIFFFFQPAGAKLNAQTDIIDYIPVRILRLNKVKCIHRKTYIGTDTSRFEFQDTYFIDSMGRCNRIAKSWTSQRVLDTFEMTYNENGKLVQEINFADRTQPSILNTYKYNEKHQLKEMISGPKNPWVYRYKQKGDTVFQYTVRKGVMDKYPGTIEVLNKDGIVKVRYDLWYNKPERHLMQNNRFDKNGLLTELTAFNIYGKLIEKLKPVYNDKNLIISDTDYLPTATNPRWSHQYTYEFFN